MKVVKCDRCGCMYDHMPILKNHKGEEVYFEDLRIKTDDYTGNPYYHHLDLCQDCVNDLIEFLNKKTDNKHLTSYAARFMKIDSECKEEK